MLLEMAEIAACFTSAGAAKSGNPCARLIAPCSRARRVISRITDSVNCPAFRETRSSAASTLVIGCSPDRLGVYRPSALLNMFAQKLEKARERDRNTVAVKDGGRTCCHQSGDGEGHGNAVVAVALDFSAAELLIPRNPQPIRPLLHFRTHAAKISRDGAEPIAL